jgi:holin-like protein
MPSPPTSTRLRRLVHRNEPLQAGLILAFWVVGQCIVKLTGVPVPGGVIGMLAILILFVTRRLSILSIRRGPNGSSATCPSSLCLQCLQCSITANFLAPSV